ncbi:MAG: DUF3185 domain-containing protein [Candidatus Polarisedimenticolia bacterium]
MKARTLLAGFLMAVGVMILTYQGIIHKIRGTALDPGPRQVTTLKTSTLLMPPIVGGIALLSGLALLVLGQSKSTQGTISDKQ